MTFVVVMVATFTLSVLLGVAIAGRGANGVARGICVGIGMNALFFAVLVFVRHEFPLLLHHSVGYFVGRAAVLAVLIGAVHLLAGLLYGDFASRRGESANANEAPRTPRSWRYRLRVTLSSIAGAVILGLAGLMLFGGKLTLSYGAHVTAEQFIFVITAGTEGTATEIKALSVNQLVTPTILAVLTGACLGLLRRDIALGRRVVRGWVLRAVAFVLALVTLIGSTIFGLCVMPLVEIVRNELSTSTYLEDHYIAPTPDVVQFPEAKRNLIHIYLESTENSFYDKAHGGYNDYTMMPDLLQLNQEGISFSNTDLMGGPLQTYGSTHSISSMVNMWTGSPMKSSISASESGMLYPDFTSLGDLLRARGYNTEFMLPGSMKWGELGSYYQDHGNFTLWDCDSVREAGILPRDYHVWWGYEDDKLFEFAKQELTRLAGLGQPFYFVMENADTHSPEGWLSPLAKERPFKEQYSNVIFYSQAEVTKFIRWIQAQDFYPNTTVVVTGDHPSMANDYFKNWDRSYQRTIVNFILNSAVPDPGVGRTHNRVYAPFDFFPTILASLGATIKGDRVGLGTNLFSDTPTLLEQDGVAVVQGELKKKSQFYWRHAKSYAASKKR